MAVTKKRLAGPLQVTNSATTRYTVPASTKTIIRKIHLYNADSSACTITLSIGADAAGTRILDAYSMAAGSILDLWGPYTMDATEVLQSNAGTTNKIVMTVDGDEITLG